MFLLILFFFLVVLSMADLCSYENYICLVKASYDCILTLLIGAFKFGLSFCRKNVFFCLFCCLFFSCSLINGSYLVLFLYSY